jgi:hypothetical protein
MNYPSMIYTIQELFHKKELSIIHINSIATLVNNLFPNKHNSSEFIIENNSLLPYYRPFLTEDMERDIIDFMMGNGKYILRNNARKSRINLIKRRPFLRYCPICVGKDIEQYGQCYWHRIHQVLGMEVCLVHKVLLLNSNVSTLDYGRLISAEKAINTKSIPSQNVSHFDKVLLVIATDIDWISRQKTGLFINKQLNNKIRVACITKGVAYYSGNLNLKKLAKSFRDHYSDEIMELINIHHINITNHYLFSNLLRSKIHYDPLLILLLIHYLDYSIEKILDLPNNYSPFGNGPWPCLNPASDHYLDSQVNKCRLIKYYNAKLRKVLPQGIFSCKCGFIYKKVGPNKVNSNPFKRSQDIINYGKVWERKLKSLWNNDNISLRGIGRKLICKIGVIQRQAYRIGLKNTKRHHVLRLKYITKYCNRINEKRGNRKKLLGIINKDPNITRKRLNREYGYLCHRIRESDKKWLESHLPPKKYSGLRKGIRRNINYGKQDIIFSNKVNNIVKILISNDGYPIRVTASNIKLLLSNRLYLDFTKYPKTKKEIHRVEETKKEYELRRNKYESKLSN